MDISSIFNTYQNTDKRQYSEFYSLYLNNLSPKLLLEIGVLKGDSLRAWSKIFPEARIVGIDIDPSTASPDLETYIGSQLDEQFLINTLKIIGHPDIIIDDGKHSRSSHITSFNILYPFLNLGGLYIIEDIETSFMDTYNDNSSTIYDKLKEILLPINYNNTTKQFKVGSTFNYLYSSVVFSHNICLVKK